MTPEQLRRVDALIAERIYGEEVFKSSFHPLMWFGSDGRPVPFYSRDITLAFDVLASFDRSVLERQGVCWFCWLDAQPPTHKAFMARAKTASLAICKAALKAKGISINSIIQSASGDANQTIKEGEGDG
jgi:hypothetical protein